MVATPGYRQGRRRTGISGEREQATARPVGRQVESRQIGIRSLVAIAGHVGVDQAGVPLHDILVRQVQFLARRVRSIDDQHVRPFHQALEYFRGAG